MHFEASPLNVMDIVPDAFLPLMHVVFTMALPSPPTLHSMPNALPDPGLCKLPMTARP